MSEEGKVKLMVILIVSMLAVTMVVAGYYQEEGESEIEVDEGYGEMEIEYLSGAGQSETFYDEDTDTSSKNATATTSLKNSNSTFRFRVIAQSIRSDEYEQLIYLNLFLNGSIEEKNELKKNLFRVKGLNGNNGSNYYYNFDLSFFEGENVELWSPDGFVSGSSGESESFIGFDVKENEFSASVRMIWGILREHWNESYTIRFESIAKGLFQDIGSTIDVQIQEEVKE